MAEANPLNPRFLSGYTGCRKQQLSFILIVSLPRLAFNVLDRPSVLHRV